MNRISKVRQVCFQIFSTVLKVMSIGGKVNSLRVCFKDESLLQPSRTTLKGLLKLKNRQVYKMHNLFH